MECYSQTTADFRAEFVTKETGKLHIGKEISDGVFAAVPAKIDDALPANYQDDDFLTSEPIPPEVKRKTRSKTATVVDFKAACSEANTSKSRAISAIIDSIDYVNIKEVCIELGWAGTAAKTNTQNKNTPLQQHPTQSLRRQKVATGI